MGTQYVCGFAFDPLGQVVLIQKKRPAWQAGKLNGVGGHVEPGEAPASAMAREFFEETGVSTLAVCWEPFLELTTESTGAVCTFFVFNQQIRDDRGFDLREVVSKTDEPVLFNSPDHLIFHHETVANVPWLLVLAEGWRGGPPYRATRATREDEDR